MRHRSIISTVIFLAIFAMSVPEELGRATAAYENPHAPVPLGIFFELDSADRRVRRGAFRSLKSKWDFSLAPMTLEILNLLDFNHPRMRSRLWSLLREKTGRQLPPRVFTWLEWLWTQEFEMHPGYPAFKARLYAPIDPRFRRWFYRGMKHTIRLDEIVWGGVRVDGIPPLEHPRFIDAAAADYLEDDHVVFGVSINGDARAYPKRVLAWHELFNDTVGGVDVSCAYCTLCGSAVLYRQRLGDRRFDFGTSGFLYRSNKLMYDRQTHSLWSALQGVPVTGELVGRGLELHRLPIVTTTWGEWRARHPDTRVLSLDTGYERDYGEGVAYREYFADDSLMFPVPIQDRRLRNKQEVVVPRLEGRPVAYSTTFLGKNRLHHDAVGEHAIVILTDRSGASRVYDRSGVRFSSWDQRQELIDTDGGLWLVTEDALSSPSGKRLPRIPSHRAFWFGWYAQFPGTRLVDD